MHAGYRLRSPCFRTPPDISTGRRFRERFCRKTREGKDFKTAIVCICYKQSRVRPLSGPTILDVAGSSSYLNPSAIPGGLHFAQGLRVCESDCVQAVKEGPHNEFSGFLYRDF